MTEETGDAAMTRTLMFHTTTITGRTDTKGKYTVIKSVNIYRKLRLEVNIPGGTINKRAGFMLSE